MKSSKTNRPLLTAALAALLFAGGSFAIASFGGVKPGRNMYTVAAKLYGNGKLLSSPKVATVSGEEVVIEQRDQDDRNVLEMKMVVDDAVNSAVKDGINLKYWFEFKRNGKTSKTKGYLVAKPNEPSTISFGDESGDNYEIQMVAIRN